LTKNFVYFRIKKYHNLLRITTKNDAFIAQKRVCMDENLKNRILELNGRAQNRGYYTYTEFLNPTAILEVKQTFKEEGVTCFGGAEWCERQIVRFGDFGYEEEFPLAVLKIAPVGEKFCSTVTHRDFLGAILNLGIERDRVGDIFTDGKVGYVCLHESVVELILAELCSVGRNKVRCEIKGTVPEEFRPKTEKLRVSVASLRIDAVICRAFNLPREDGAKLCKEGRVFVDGRLVESASYVPKEGETVAVKGYGKLRFCGINGTSSRGRTFLDVEKYI